MEMNSLKLRGGRPPIVSTISFVPANSSLHDVLLQLLSGDDLLHDCIQAHGRLTEGSAARLAEGYGEISERVKGILPLLRKPEDHFRELELLRRFLMRREERTPRTQRSKNSREPSKLRP